jgi:hypothetical protein
VQELNQDLPNGRKEHPGACIQFQTDKLEVPRESTPLELTSHSNIRITTVVDPETEVLRLLYAINDSSSKYDYD